MEALLAALQRYLDAAVAAGLCTQAGGFRMADHESEPSQETLVF